MGFDGKVAIVTGGASGIGAALTGLLVDQGVRVVVADIDEELGRTAIERLGAAARFVRCDVARPDDADALVGATAEMFGGIDLLFNNAGVSGGAAAEPTPADWARLIEINLNSVFYLSRAAIPHMHAAGGGAIVNTASVSGLFGDYGTSAYNAAKGGVVNYTRSLAVNQARHNIRVNAVCPGLIWDTAMTKPIADTSRGFAPWAARIPMGRGGNAIEIAHVMLFLASDAASYLTGQAIAVDGGITAHTGFPGGDG